MGRGRRGRGRETSWRCSHDADEYPLGIDAATGAIAAARVAGYDRGPNGPFGAPVRRIHAPTGFIRRDHVARLMRAAGLAGVSRRRGLGTTRRAAQARPAPDLVNRRFEADAPNRLWVADIT